MTVARTLLGLAYPFVVFAGLYFADARTVALGIGTLLVVRAALGWHRPSAEALRRLVPLGLGVAVVLGAAALLNDPRGLLFVPAAVNVALLAAFARTLRGPGPTMIETFARLQHPELSEERIAHCRAVTRVWCGFFVLNGAACAFLAFRGDLQRWTLYTGLVSYLLMGALFGAEYAIRTWRFDRQRGTLQ